MKCSRGLAMRILSVRLSVRPSVKRVDCDITEENLVNIFSERELKFMFAICHRRSVCRLSSVCLSVCLSSVTLVRPTQTIEIFGNISTSCGTLAIRELCIKILPLSLIHI